MKSFGLAILAVGLAGAVNAGTLTMAIVPQSTEVGRYTAFCGVVRIENRGTARVEFGCPSPASGTMGFEVRHNGAISECISGNPLRGETKLAVLDPGESLYVPFLVMNTDDCDFIFAEEGQYEVAAFVRYRRSPGSRVDFEACKPIVVDVYDWKDEDEWARQMKICSIPTAFGLDFDLAKMDGFAAAKPVEPMIPFLLGGGKTLNAFWRGDTRWVGELYSQGQLTKMEGTIGNAMWEYLRTAQKTLTETPVFEGGDYVLGY